MKAILTLNNYGETLSPVGFGLLADSAVTNCGKPFYIPENVGQTCVTLAMAIRINRLGKGIKEKFASRYFSEMAPALHFFLPDYAAALRDESLPEDPAHSFDKALFVSDFLDFSQSSIIELTINDNKVAEFNPAHLKKNIDKLIEEISIMNTLKMGDLIVPGVNGSFPIYPGDILEVFVNTQKAFQVRVK